MERVKNLVSVIMSNYNTPEDFLRPSIESVLNQSYESIELIIVDDCSTDDSLSVIQSYKDERIVVLKNEKNSGITKSLNRALNVAKGEFIARMDSDDICFKNRIEKQVEFLKNNTDVIVCGTGVQLIGNWEASHTNEKMCRFIPEKDLFRIQLLFGNYPNIVHPTAMFNGCKLDEYGIRYNENYIFAQDYRMWVECSKYAECANVPETLLYYRVHGGAVSSSKKAAQAECALNIMKEQLKELHLELPEELEAFHGNLLTQRKAFDLKYKKWLKLIISQNKKYKVYDSEKLEEVLWKKWAEITYFGLRKQKSVFGILKIIFSYPVSKMKFLLDIKKQRARQD